MLLELRLENYAVIDSLVVEFGSGLNLLTGETGAGKSILIDALSLLLGEKASANVIRTGTERAILSAVFDLSQSVEKPVLKLLEANGIDSADNRDSIILRREISTAGKGRVFVNNQPATVSVLRQLSPLLASIHAQSESIVSFDPGARLELLDTFAGFSLSGLEHAFEHWKSVAARIKELEQGEQDRLRLLDLWKFQKREIEDSKVYIGEDQKLASEKRVLANSEKIHAAALNAFDLLYEGGASASSSLRAAQKHLEELVRYEPKFQEHLAALEAARINAEDVGATLRDYASGIQASPARLAEVEDRLAVIDRLKRKYGATLEEVIVFGEEVSRKVAEVENRDDILRDLHGQRIEASRNYLDCARAASKKRHDAARKLEKLAGAQINDLAMKVRFHIELKGTDEEQNWSPSGFDEVVYLISTNPGEPLRPLEEIASGGELSRCMLALKSSIEAGSAGQGKNGAQRTLVFDEIDIGIGGSAAEAVGKKLKSLSRRHQVLCVTHLPQIATFADHHYLIEKKESAGRTRTGVRPITGRERTEEIARMLSGAKLTDTSRKHAEQMLRTNA